MAVLLIHVGFLALLSLQWRNRVMPKGASESWMMLQPPPIRSDDFRLNVPFSTNARRLRSNADAPSIPKIAPLQPLPSIVPDIPSPPSVDWSHEGEVVAQNALTNAERESTYRNLAGLSPEQRKWMEDNRYEHAPPGIPWQYRRVEPAEGGFPIIHINDHCIAVPFLMFMVFCKVGHIEPKGDLFNHMRDPRNPLDEDKH